MLLSVPRPIETDPALVNASRQDTTALIEGSTVFEQDYVKSVETEITMTRKFKMPGYTYNLTLIR